MSLSMIEMNTIVGIMFIFARISGAVLLNPIFGRRNIPAIFKVSLSLVLTLLLFSYLPISINPGTTLEFMIGILIEFSIGYVLGYVITLFSNVIVMGGEIIDFQMGMSMAKVFDAQSNTSIGLSSTFFNIIFMFLFFLSNGHLALIRFFLDSHKVVPYGEAALSENVSVYMIELFSDTAVLAMQLAMPVIAVTFMLEIGVGILMKIIPQINIFVVNIQLKIFVGLSLLLIMYAPFVSFIEELITFMFDALAKSLGAIG